jgi:GNAT superfamily N-acetyltransferase
VTIEITPVSGMEQLERWVAIHNEIRPDDPATTEHKALIRAEEGGERVDLLAYLDGEPVGTGLLSADVETLDTGRPWVHVNVLPAYRGRGVGGALLRAASDHARALGRTGLSADVMGDDAYSLGFLERRGFVEYRRWEQFELVRDVHDATVAPAPAGVDIVSLIERPDLLEGMHRVAAAVYPTLGGHIGRQAESFIGWQAYALGGPGALLDLALMAVADDDVVGFAAAKDVDETTAELEMVAVLPEWRRRGIGHALVAAQVASAKHERLVTWVVSGTEPGRVYSGLGFRRTSGAVELRGPLQ